MLAPHTYGYVVPRSPRPGGVRTALLSPRASRLWCDSAASRSNRDNGARLRQDHVRARTSVPTEGTCRREPHGQLLRGTSKKGQPRRRDGRREQRSVQHHVNGPCGHHGHDWSASARPQYAVPGELEVSISARPASSAPRLALSHYSPTATDFDPSLPHRKQ